MSKVRYLQTGEIGDRCKRPSSCSGHQSRLLLLLVMVMILRFQPYVSPSFQHFPHLSGELYSCTNAQCVTWSTPGGHFHTAELTYHKSSTPPLQRILCFKFFFRRGAASSVALPATHFTPHTVEPGCAVAHFCFQKRQAALRRGTYAGS